MKSNMFQKTNIWKNVKLERLQQVKQNVQLHMQVLLDIAGKFNND